MAAPGIRVTTDFQTPIPRLDEATELAIYRIAQEALANAFRHASPTHVGVTLAVHDGRLRLEIVDDGRGFDAGLRRADAFGLVSMEERALAVGGRLSVSSEHGRGTVVRLECPVVARAAPASAA
jgi:two-component system sensor histidine kinase UhpB